MNTFNNTQLVSDLDILAFDMETVLEDELEMFELSDWTVADREFDTLLSDDLEMFELSDWSIADREFDFCI